MSDYHSTEARRAWQRAYWARTRERREALRRERDAARPPLTAERLRERVHYDPETGIFTSLINHGKVRVGDICGKVNREGYRQIQVDGKLYSAHRLAWLYVHGAWPKPFLDHEGRDKDDNRIAKLREVTKSQNGQNTGRNAKNTSGYKGVWLDRSVGRWRAKIKVDGKTHYLGSHDTAELAAQAYALGAAKYHTHNPVAESVDGVKA